MQGYVERETNKSGQTFSKEENALARTQSGAPECSILEKQPFPC